MEIPLHSNRIAADEETTGANTIANLDNDQTLIMNCYFALYQKVLCEDTLDSDTTTKYCSILDLFHHCHGQELLLPQPPTVLQSHLHRHWEKHNVIAHMNERIFNMNHCLPALSTEKRGESVESPIIDMNDDVIRLPNTFSTLLTNILTNLHNQTNTTRISVTTEGNQSNNVVTTTTTITAPSQSSQQQQQRDDAEKCAICLEGMILSVDDLLVSSGCKHMYHSDCINEWRIQSALCPQCRVRMDLQSANPVKKGGNKKQRVLPDTPEGRIARDKRNERRRDLYREKKRRRQEEEDADRN